MAFRSLNQARKADPQTIFHTIQKVLGNTEEGAIGSLQKLLKPRTQHLLHLGCVLSISQAQYFLSNIFVYFPIQNILFFRTFSQQCQKNIALCDLRQFHSPVVSGSSKSLAQNKCNKQTQQKGKNTVLLQLVLSNKVSFYQIDSTFFCIHQEASSDHKCKTCT